MADGVVDEGKDLGISRGEIAENNQLLTFQSRALSPERRYGLSSLNYACAVYDDDSAWLATVWAPALAPWVFQTSSRLAP